MDGAAYSSWRGAGVAMSSLSDFRRNHDEYFGLGRLLPFRRSLLSHLVTIYLLVWVQVYIATPLLGAYYIDWVTPYLVYLFISNPFRYSIICLFWSSALLEQGWSGPAGAYLSAYGFIMMLMLAIRDHVSWFHPVGWSLCSAASMVWFGFYFTMIFYVHDVYEFLEHEYVWTGWIWRTILSVPSVLLWKFVVELGEGKEVTI